MFYPCLLVSVWFSSSVRPPVCLYWLPSGSGSLSLSLWSELLSTSSRPLLSDITHILLSLFPPRLLVYILYTPKGGRQSADGASAVTQRLALSSCGYSPKQLDLQRQQMLALFCFPFLPRQYVIHVPQSSPFLQQCVRAFVLCSNHNCCGFYSLRIISPNHYLFILTEWINRLVGKGQFFSVITHNDTLLIHPLVLHTSPGSWRL